MQPEKPYLFRS